MWVIVNFVTSANEEVFYVSEKQEKKENKFLKAIFNVLPFIFAVSKYL